MKNQNQTFIKAQFQGHNLFTADGLTIISHLEQLLKQNNKPPIRLTYYNLHGISISLKSPKFKKIISSADIAIIDGKPIIWALRALKYPVTSNFRATMLDWLPPLFEIANKNSYNIFLLGTTHENILNAKNNLLKQYQRINFEISHGYFKYNTQANTPQNENTINTINKFKPDILLVGMGMPKQELWIAHNIKYLNAQIIIPVGGFFDYIGGASYIPPRWTGHYGLEWLMRLINDPRRLGYRYLVEPWPVLCSIIKEILKTRFLSKNT